ncbi:hypothetical protein SMGD1_2309 [Sulfurimonas gotlandica GD1]|jgi:hypothetical protein|uniref:Uncharacterized protein n=1 Tax=Sulfurimonas gotlandica (strain DSM 19862 / JCM 16533 / GD1) TaxID=929558 RepID=B6BMQ1_SULGG|nr:hypothetical protein [Sulfurimonas gotlandica]EDZ61646.1 conserved hypothetical protein [Sulfurimonas gotlandica GD1]EHP30832.1 hypothetical protein SMGD1_2309 [Sulfurimonas gotlandica GD1]
MIYKSKIGDIDLAKLTRLYPAAVVEMQGEVAEMSLEWIEMNEDKVNLKEYILVFDFTPLKEEVKDKKVLHFETKDELIQTMTEVAQFFQD